MPDVELHRDLRASVRELCRSFPDTYWRELDAQRAYPDVFVKALTEAGYLAALIPEEFGGSGLGVAEASIILEEINRSGGNAGACHGARAGQKGFRLTLFGFDVDADYTYLTRQAIGRRIVPTDPGRSLILTKPTGLLPHKGGVRLDPSSLEYRVLAEWIAAGAPGPQDDDPQITKVEVLPQYTTQAVGNSQLLVVLAHFSDGHVEDATRWAKYTAVSSTVTSNACHVPESLSTST